MNKERPTRPNGKFDRLGGLNSMRVVRVAPGIRLTKGLVSTLNFYVCHTSFREAGAFFEKMIASEINYRSG